ncbi:MAG: Mut7-C RNAse domain-containing protein [Archaeoglobaceae archaeon]|nr:Mut7-C RNAse domain-containing protein [Archaeoglobaceae archaeon]MDW8118078.1 Mut7-C RNAse domain-containing protein [Archaeoglobaceae archaeon]
MVEMKFICDRMLGKLAVWLRISGYDTLYIGEFTAENEDDFLIENFKDRVLLTKDRRLFSKAKKYGRKVLLIRSNDVAEQMKELKEIGVKFQIVMDRCSVCNNFLRKPTKEEALTVLKEQGLPEDMLERYELWFCENCRKLYWMGGHWVNMVRFLKKIED